MPLRSIHVVANGKISFLFMAKYYSIVYTTFSLSIHQWALRALCWVPFCPHFHQHLLSHIIFFFFPYLFIYLFIYLFLAVLGLRFVRGLSPVAASGGHPSSRCGGRSSSRCAGLPPPRPPPSRGTGSRRAGSAIVAHGPSRSAACGILPDQGSNPCPLH